LYAGISSEWRGQEDRSGHKNKQVSSAIAETALQDGSVAKSAKRL